MKIVTTFFEYPDYPHQYEKLHAVLEVSCKKHMPDVEFITLNLKADFESNGRHIGYAANTAKINAQNRYVQQVDDDIILIDADMMCVGQAYHAFDHNFDIAYTMRTKINSGGASINGGVVMVRNTGNAKNWFNDLTTVNNNLYEDKKLHAYWNRRFPGMNQAAMGFMIYGPGQVQLVRIVEYKTRVWNAVDCDWKHFNEETIFVHCKGRLREAIEKNSGPGVLAPIVKTWYNYLYETDYSHNDGTERGYVVEKINTINREVCGPYTRHRHRKHGRHR